MSETAYLAAGCFWGPENTFAKVEGVLSTRVGYAGGNWLNPSYEEVCSGETGHAETIKVEFDPEIVGFEELLNVFWNLHDPTTANRQGPDLGTQYRSAIFVVDEAQKEIACASREKMQNSGKFKEKIVTEISPFTSYYDAEEYHQQYMKKKWG